MAQGSKIEGLTTPSGNGAALMNDQCQNELLPYGSSRIPRAVILVGQVKHYLRQRGFLATIKRVISFLASRAPARARMKQERPAVKPAVLFFDILNLQPGDLVEVRSEDEIQQTLDSEGRNRGLSFTPAMREYCGKKLRVFKRVRQICMEARPNEMRRLENTVILEGAICNGGSRSCDRSCFFFWREAWLRRPSEPSKNPSAGAA